MHELRAVTDLPRRARVVEHAWIPLPCGTRLAAKLWLPEGAEDAPVPAVLEYIPYRKRDVTAVRDAVNHGYFAGHGYAGVRVDLRGSGDSEGVLTDEYLEQELRDGEEVLRWIAAQPWCDGSVGMIGKSWGGFNALQLAARRPPELRAVISLCSSDDRYSDDVHYMGGCLLGDNLSWAAVMFSYNASPPDPAIMGDAWRERWLERLEQSGLWLETWLRHQRRDGYWRHGSICEDYAAIACPVLAVSGWADGYTNAVFRLLQNLRVPRRGLIGPWSHELPHLGTPGPAIGFLQEAVRWWDHWLAGRDNDVMDEPMLRVWLQDSVPPTTRYVRRPGRWVGEASWPSPRIEERAFAMASDYTLRPTRPTAVDESFREVPKVIQSPLSVGLFAGKWCSYSGPPDLPGDQREEDGGALIFESGPLRAPVEVLGAPTVEVELASTQPVALLAARLSDVAPDRKATRVTYGLLNLTHRGGDATPVLLEPGHRYRVTLSLNHVGHVFPPGHHLRISLSTSYWPLAWPPPHPVRLTVFTGASTLRLPVRPPRAEDAGLRPFGDPEGAPPPDTTVVAPPHSDWRVIRGLGDLTSTLEVTKDEGTVRLDAIDLTVERRLLERYSFQGEDFASLRGETLGRRAFRRGDWSIVTETRIVLTCDPANFHVEADLKAWEGDRAAFERTWRASIPRDQM